MGKNAGLDSLSITWGVSEMEERIEEVVVEEEKGSKKRSRIWDLEESKIDIEM